MKSNSIVIVLFIAFALVSCMPAAAPAPTDAILPIPTFTPIPPASTVRPAPENISDSKSLSTWADEFVHAYGGITVVNGVEMDTTQLTEELRKNGDKYIQSKQINETEFLFLVVNEVPLAMREGNGSWQEATMARLSELTGVVFEFSPRIPDDRISQYTSVLKKVAGKNSRFTFPSEMDTCRIYNTFSPDDWKSIIVNWNNIQQDLDNGKIPDGYPYEWQGVYNIIDFAKRNVTEPQFRAQHIMEIRLDYCMLADSIINLWEKEKFSKDDMLKVLEFVVRTRVVKFPEITHWDVEDEMIAADVVAQTGGDKKYRFWLNVTGKSAVELTTLVSEWIKRSNPNAETYIVEDEVFDNKNPNAKWQIDAFDQYIQGLNASSAKVDKIIIENNLWIFAPPDTDYISEKIDEFMALGFSIGGAETMVVTGDNAINGDGRSKLVKVDDGNLAQAELIGNLLSLYLNKGIKDFGFGGIDDYNAWTNDVGLPDANPLLFDDDFRAKLSYYAVVQVLYKQLP